MRRSDDQQEYVHLLLPRQAAAQRMQFKELAQLDDQSRW